MKTLTDVHLDRLEVLESVPDSPAELFEFNRETLITDAIEVSERFGARIVPLNGAKEPLMADWPNNAVRTRSQITKELSGWHVKGAGVVLPSGYCVVDTDTAEAEQWAQQQLPETFTVQTHKGYHRYYSVPGPIRQDRQGIHSGVDILNGKNYLVYVGSVHPDTGQVGYFHTDRDRAVSELPERLYEQLNTDAEGKRARTAGKAVSEAYRDFQGLLNDSMEVSESAAANADQVIEYLTENRPVTLDKMHDTSDGRNDRFYFVVLSLLQSGCGNAEEIYAVLARFPLWGKALAKGNPSKYLTDNVNTAQEFIAENPAERMTLPYWRRMVNGASLKPGYMKVLDAIGQEAFRQSKQIGNDVTRLTLSSRMVGIGSSMSFRNASTLINKAVKDKWLFKITDPVKGSGYAPVYLLTVPKTGPFATVEEREVVSIDGGHDAFRHGALASAAPVYKELQRGSGTAKDLHERTGKATSIQALRKNLNKLKDAEIAYPEKSVWKLAEDHDFKLDYYAEKIGTLGKREEQKEQYRVEREYWALRNKNDKKGESK